MMFGAFEMSSASWTRVYACFDELSATERVDWNHVFIFELTGGKYTLKHLENNKAVGSHPQSRLDAVKLGHTCWWSELQTFGTKSASWYVREHLPPTIWWPLMRFPFFFPRSGVDLVPVCSNSIGFYQLVTSAPYLSLVGCLYKNKAGLSEKEPITVNYAHIASGSPSGITFRCYLLPRTKVACEKLKKIVTIRKVLMYGTTMLLKEEAVATLKQFDIGEKFSYLPVLPKASVLIPLFVRGGQLHTLLTLRSQELRTGAGEVCFPGGKRDPSDQDDVHTALREAHEEIGLPPDQVEVVCTLFPVFSKKGLLVSPVVGFIEETFIPALNPSEVSAVFAVPLDFFTREKDHYATHGVAGVTGPLHSFYFRDPASGNQYHIWGLTAMLATLVGALALKKKPEFNVGFDILDPFTFFKKILHKRLSKL